MHQKLEQYLTEKKKERQKIINQKKSALLIREGLYYKTLVGKGEGLSYEENVDSKWNYDTGQYEYYKKIPIEISDEEYEELKRVCAPMQEEIVDNVDNKIVTALQVIAWTMYIGGFFAGIALGSVEVISGSYFTYTDTEFSFAIALTYWAVGLISGTMFLGFAEIIKLLESIKRK